MLDAFKKTDAGRQQAAELQALITASREERAALSAMITQDQLQSAKLTAASKALHRLEESIEERTANPQLRLEDVDARIARAEEMLRRLETLAMEMQNQLSAAPASRPAAAPRKPRARKAR
jgi:hypothetical protein